MFSYDAAVDTNGDNRLDVAVELNTDGGLTDTYHVERIMTGGSKLSRSTTARTETMDEIYEDTNFDTYPDTVIL